MLKFTDKEQYTVVERGAKRLGFVLSAVCNAAQVWYFSPSGLALPGPKFATREAAKQDLADNLEARLSH